MVYMFYVQDHGEFYNIMIKRQSWVKITAQLIPG